MIDIYAGFSEGKGNIHSKGIIVSCSNPDICELYKKGLCVLRYSWFSSGMCKYGNREVIQGPTRRSSKYYKFKEFYIKNPVYDKKLETPSNAVIIYRIGDEYRLHINDLYFNENNKYDCQLKKATGYVDTLYLKKEEFDPDFIHAICRSSDRFDSLWSRDNFKKHIPEYLYQFMKTIPEAYGLFILKYPNYAEIKPNHIGKKAFVYSLEPGCIIKENGQSFKFDGEYLTCDTYNHWTLFDNKIKAEVKIKVTSDLTCEITDNSQVGLNTIFV